MTKSDNEGNILVVTGSVWMSPGGDSIIVYFSDEGLPIKAISSGHIALIRNPTDTSADFVMIDPNGEIETYFDVSMDNASIRHVYKTATTGGSPKVASLLPLAQQDELKMP